MTVPACRRQQARCARLALMSTARFHPKGESGQRSQRRRASRVPCSALPCTIQLRSIGAGRLLATFTRGYDRTVTWSSFSGMLLGAEASNGVVHHAPYVDVSSRSVSGWTIQRLEFLTILMI